jgi:hypothetical protein
MSSDRQDPTVGQADPADDQGEPLRTELVAVLVAVVDGLPHVLTSAGQLRLPSGPLESQHRSMQAGLR